ncbi:MAG: hypothetical protein IT583_00265, partial [Verrucomicrobia bacterium]|nr:hypothetical protein [Verrucomicrobiota bacterium]
MTGPVFKAGGLIWLVVGAFWVIAQIAGAAAKKNQPQRPTTDTESDKAPSDPFAEMLRKMAGVDEFRIEPPERVEEAVKPQKPAAVSRGRTSSVDVS